MKYPLNKRYFFTSDLIYTHFYSFPRKKGYSVGTNPYITSTFFADQRTGWHKKVILKTDYLLQVRNIYNSIMNLDKLRYPNIYRAITDIRQVRMITNLSMLKVLSCFSIIECLLTHAPRSSDAIDSLTHIE